MYATSKRCSGSIVRSSIVASRVTDPGSNPGWSTITYFSAGMLVNPVLVSALVGQYLVLCEKDFHLAFGVFS